MTLIMFPILGAVYVRLAIAEERDAASQFGEDWYQYARRTPRFIAYRGGGKTTPAS